MTSRDSRNATSSQGSESGATPCEAPTGPMTDLFGQAVARVSPSPSPASSVAAKMSATYGRRSSGSSASAALTLALVSRYRELTEPLGSTMFALTWKASVTPWGRYLPQQRASAHRTSGSGCIGWRTPAAQNAERGGQDGMERLEAGHAMNLQDEAMLSPWPTPMAGTPAQNGNNAAGNNDYSRAVVDLAAWPTPNTPSGGRSVDPSKMSATGRTLDGRKHTVSLEHVVRFAAWPTTTKQDAARMVASAWPTPAANEFEHADTEAMLARRERIKAKGINGNGFGLTLGMAAALASPRATPSARDHKDASDPASWNCTEERSRMDQLPRQVFGVMPNGSPAATEKRGQLNPALSRWLMGLPKAWDECAPIKSKKSKAK